MTVAVVKYIKLFLGFFTNDSSRPVDIAAQNLLQHVLIATLHSFGFDLFVDSHLS